MKETFEIKWERYRRKYIDGKVLPKDRAGLQNAFYGGAAALLFQLIDSECVLSCNDFELIFVEVCDQMSHLEVEFDLKEPVPIKKELMDGDEEELEF